MGRPRRAPEQRIEAIPEQLRVDLLMAKREHERAARELEASRQELGEVIAKTVKETHVSLRDIAALLGVVHQTVHQLYKDASDGPPRAKPGDHELAKRSNETAKKRGRVRAVSD